MRLDPVHMTEMPAPIQRELRAGTARIAYQVSGEGPPLVLLHGLSGSSRWWARNVPFLARRFRVYVIDLIGFGRSRGQPFALREAPGLILRWMDSLSEERFSIAGHSMGGFIAACIAADAPARIDHLVLVDALALPIGRSVVRSTLGLVEALRYAPVDFWPVLAEDALRAGPVNLLRAIRDIHRADLLVDLSRIHARTLVVWGEHDTLLPVRFGETLYQQLRLSTDAAQFVVIRGAGHNPMWDRAGDFNRALLDFMDGDGR